MSSSLRVMAARAESQARGNHLKVGELEIDRRRFEVTMRGRPIALTRKEFELLAILAGLALTLASVGLYGVLSYFVGERTREIGVRRALGASNGSVVSLVLGRGARLVAFGLVLGGLGVLGAMRLMEGLLYEVGTTDPLALGGAVMVLGLVGAVACLLPAARAARVDPAVTLRGE